MRALTVLAISAMSFVASCQSSSSILQQQVDAATDQEICGAARTAMYELNRNMPSRPNKVAENVKVAADCNRRTIVYTARVLADESTFPSNWKDELAEVVRKAFCDDEFATILGWKVETIVLSRSDRVLMRIQTSPKDCN